MKKFLLLSLTGLLLAAAGGVGWLFLRQPAMAPPREVRVPMTPERVARGKYLFEVVADCDGCHSERDFTRFAGPVVVSGRGKGFRFPAEMGLPGDIIAPNITPDVETGIGAWTDGDWQVFQSLLDLVGPDLLRRIGHPGGIGAGVYICTKAIAGCPTCGRCGGWGERIHKGTRRNTKIPFVSLRVPLWISAPTWAPLRRTASSDPC